MTTDLENIATTVRCFRTPCKGSKGYGIWAMTTETRGVFYTGDGYERQPPRWSVAELESSDQLLVDSTTPRSIAITPEEAIAELAYWPEAQADLRKVFARHPVPRATAEPSAAVEPAAPQNIGDILAAGGKAWERIAELEAELATAAPRGLDTIGRGDDHGWYLADSCDGKQFNVPMFFDGRLCSRDKVEGSVVLYMDDAWTNFRGPLVPKSQAPAHAPGEVASQDADRDTLLKHLRRQIMLGLPGSFYSERKRRFIDRLARRCVWAVENAGLLPRSDENQLPELDGDWAAPGEVERLREERDEAIRVRDNAHSYSAAKCAEIIDLQAKLTAAEQRLAEPCPLVHHHCAACGCAINEDGGCNCDDNRSHGVAALERDLRSRYLMEIAKLRKCETAVIPTLEDLEAENAALKQRLTAAEKLADRYRDRTIEQLGDDYQVLASDSDCVHCIGVSIHKLQERVTSAEHRLALAGGFHERTEREAEIERVWKGHIHIQELLSLIDAGRNRLAEAEQTIDAMLSALGWTGSYRMGPDEAGAWTRDRLVAFSQPAAREQVELPQQVISAPGAAIKATQVSLDERTRQEIARGLELGPKAAESRQRLSDIAHVPPWLSKAMGSTAEVPPAAREQVEVVEGDGSQRLKELLDKFDAKRFEAVGYCQYDAAAAWRDAAAMVKQAVAPAAEVEGRNV